MLPQVTEILFATDLSQNANNALRHALGMAHAHNAKVHVVHVTEPLTSDAIVTMRMFMQDDASQKRAIQDRHASVKALLSTNQKDFVKSLSDDEKETYKLVASVELIEGHPAEAILQRADKLDCDLIVMATHEHGTGHTFLGTVAKRVLRRAAIPTLVVPNPND